MDDLADTHSVASALRALLPSFDAAAAARPETFPAFVGAMGCSAALPEVGSGLDVVLEELAAAVGHGCHISDPGFFGFITTGATTAPIAAQAAVAVAGGQRYLLHAFNQLEHVALAWLADLCGIPATAGGVFTGGGSTANLIALGAARQAAYERLGVDVADDGLQATAAPRVYGSARAHRTIHRSAAVLGLGRNAVVTVATDAAGRMIPGALADAIDADLAAGLLPVAVVAVAGTTDTGVVDPIRNIVSIARSRDCWVHVDGAYGLIAHASPSLASLFDGSTDADSWIVDPHKWLATGVGVGAAYVRDPGVLTRAFAEGHADYLEGSFDREPDHVSEFDSLGGDWGDQGVELSAPPRGPHVWAVLREIGRTGVAARVDRHVALARNLADAVAAHPRLELLAQPELSIVCYRYRAPETVDADALNARLLVELRRTTRTVPSSTVVNGHFALRPCFINPRVEQRDVDALLRNSVTIGTRLANECG